MEATETPISYPDEFCLETLDLQGRVGLVYTGETNLLGDEIKVHVYRDDNGQWVSPDGEAFDEDLVSVNVRIVVTGPVGGEVLSQRDDGSYFLTDHRFEKRAVWQGDQVVIWDYDGSDHVLFGEVNPVIAWSALHEEEHILGLSIDVVPEEWAVCR